MTNNILKDIEEIENNINEQTQTKSRLEGKKEETEERLKKDYNITDLKNVSITIVNLEKESSELENKIQTKIKELKEKWQDD